MPVQLSFTPQTAFSQGIYAGGAKVNFYLSGTDTEVTTYTTETLSTPHPKPLVADSYGVFAQVFTDGTSDIKAVITTSVDTAIVTIDPVAITSQSGSQAMDISFAPVTGNPATNVQDAIEVNTAALEAQGSITGEDFTDNNDLSVDPDNIGTRGNVAAQVLDEDDMATDSATRPPSQQSTKAYVASVAARDPGLPIVFGANYDLLVRTVISGSPSVVDSVFDPAGYDRVRIEISNLYGSTDGMDVHLRTSSNSGSSFDASTYPVTYNTLDSVSGPLYGADSLTYMRTFVSVGNSGSEDGIGGHFDIFGPNSGFRKTFDWRLSGYTAAGRLTRREGIGVRTSTAVINAVRIYPSSGTFATNGIISVYGVRNT